MAHADTIGGSTSDGGQNAGATHRRQIAFGGPSGGGSLLQSPRTVSPVNPNMSSEMTPLPIETASASVSASVMPTSGAEPAKDAKDFQESSMITNISDHVKDLSLDVASLHDQLGQLKLTLPLLLAEGLMKASEQQIASISQLLQEHFEYHAKRTFSHLELKFDQLMSADLGTTELNVDSGYSVASRPSPKPSRADPEVPQQALDASNVQLKVLKDFVAFEREVMTHREHPPAQNNETHSPQRPSEFSSAGRNTAVVHDASAFLLDLDADGPGADGAALGAPDAGNLLDEPYRVEKLYRKDGWASAVASSELFMNLTLVAIVLNAAYIGIAADNNKEDALYDSSWFFIVFDNGFCVFFVVELLVRYLAFANKRDCLGDGWFRFDSAMLLLMVVETWIVAPIQKLMETSKIPIPVEPLRLFRLLRLTRLARLMRNVPELVTMTQGLVQGARACGASVIMIMILMYIFAIALHSFLKDEEALNRHLKDEYQLQFASLGSTMWFLMIDGVFMLDNTGLIMTTLLETERAYPVVSCFVILSFIFLAAMVICNMLVGVLCEVVAQVAQRERDEKAVFLLKDSMIQHLQQYDDGDGMVSKDELEKVMNEPESKKLLITLNVDRVFMMALQKMLFTKHTQNVPIKSVMELMLSCRRDSPATVHTISINLSFMSTRLDEVDRSLRRLLKTERQHEERASASRDPSRVSHVPPREGTDRIEVNV